VRRFASVFGFCLLALFVPLGLAAQTDAPAAASNKATAAHAATDSALMHPATLKAKAPDVYEVTFTTTKGDFVVQVTRAWSPAGADRFYNLVKHGYYNDMRLFRVVSGFVIQFGLTGNPAINKAWQDANIKDDPVTQSNKPGYLTFATAGKDTRTTQVFINLGDNSRLDTMGFTPFGQITSGMDVLQQLYSGYADTPTSHQDEITKQGNAYLDKNFPKLDSIKTAKVTSPASAAPAAAAKKPAASQPKPQN
jgi:peptidyl-prolyl cis-trans isomerase A (cyclophilin A)